MQVEELHRKMKGVMVVMTTPFKANFELDTEGLRKNVQFLIGSGIKTGNGVLIPGGSNGECHLLRISERKKIAEIVVEEANGEVPVLVGCNHTGTGIVIELAQYAEEAGADGIMLAPPYYWRLSEKTIINHYKAVADSISIGMMVYNNSSVAQVDLSIEAMKELAKVANIIAIKDCSGDLPKSERMVRELGDKIAVLNGNGESWEPYCALMGKVGLISGMAQFAPKIALELYLASKEGDFKKAVDIRNKISPFIDFYKDVTATYDRSAQTVINKEAQNILGIPAGPPRLPLLPLPDELGEKLRGILQNMGLRRLDLGVRGFRRVV